MDGRQSYEVIHKGGLMESDTKTENYKNTSLLPSAWLKENLKKKNPSGPQPLGPPHWSLVLVRRGVPSWPVPSPPFSRLV